MEEQYFLKPSKVYAILKRYVLFTISIFYESISVEGLENIPKDTPVLFTPNHQNALMDALSVIIHSHKQPVFMAKADIFKSPPIRKVLNILKIIPVYRIRDGYENLSNNDESFQIVLKCLLSYNHVGIMPEGTQTDLQQLQLLKKGFARLALNAQQQLGSRTGISVIPVGIHYRNFYSFRSNIHISFGKPIDVREYIPTYEQNQPKALLDLRDTLSNGIKDRMVSIDNTEYYELIKDCKDITANEFQEDDNENCFPFESRFRAEKLISNCLSSHFSLYKEDAMEMKNLVNEYKTALRRLHIVNEVFEHNYPSNFLGFDIIRYVFFFPLVALGAVCNFIPAYITSFLSKKVEDAQFISSIKYVLGVIIFPLYYLIILLLPIHIIIKVLFVLTMPVLGILAYDYFSGVTVFLSRIRLQRGLHKNDPAVSRLLYARSQIIKLVGKCIGNKS